MRSMQPAEREAHVKSEIKKRDDIKAKIATLGKERESHVAEERKKLASSADKTIDTALIESVKKQAAGKRYTFTE